jgi:hypothetical protein
VNEFIIKDELEKVSPEGYNEYLLGCDEICLSGNNGAAPGEAVINDVYLETYDDEGEKTYATFESPTNTNTTWNSETKTFTWSTTYYNQLRNIGLPNGDISKYKKLVVDCTIKSGEKFRVLFYKGGSNLTLYAEDGVNEFIIKDELEKVSPEGYNEYLLGCDEICLSGNNGAAPGEAIINSVYLETYPENESVEIPEIEYEEDPGMPEGEYIDFTEAFPELSPKIGLGEDTHPIVIGNGDVVVGQRSKNVIADLSDYSTLTLVTTPGLKLVVYMNHEVDAQQNLGDYAAEDEGKYEFVEAQAGEDGLYTLDLTQYDKQDLNCICLPWDNNNKGTVWYILLQEAEAEPEPATYAITIADTENGTVAADVEEAAEGDKVTLTITPAEGYELDELSVAAGETAVEVAEDNTFTMPAAEVTVTATFKEIEPETEPIEYALDNISKNTELLKEVTSVEALTAAPFLLKGEDGLMPYTPGKAPDSWDIYVSEPVTVLADVVNGGYFEMEAVELAGVEGTNYLIKVLNIDKTHRTTPGWAGGLAYLNTQPVGVNEIIFGLNGKNDQHGQDAANHAVWTVSYEEGKGFAFHNVGRDIYLGHDGKQARPVEEAYYWKAYNDFSAGYDKDETEGVGDLAAADVRTADAKKALEDAKAAYEVDGDLNKYGDAVNAAVDAIKACEAVAADYQDLDAAGKAVAENVAASYEAGEYADLSALRAAYREAAKAQTTAGADMTGAIINPSFEWVSIEGWTSTNCGNFATNKNFGARTGDIFVERWTQAPGTLSDGTFLQTISGLPKGKYTLTAEMQNLEQGNENADGTGYFLVANDASAEVATAGETVSVDAFVGEDGELTIGTKLEGCSGNWVCVDNFVLTFVEPGAEPEPDAINSVAEDAAPADGKYIENGQIVIVKDGVKYNVAGQIVK